MFLLPFHLFDDELANHSNLATGCWQFVVVWKSCFLVDENDLNAIILLWASRDARWWLRCLLRLLLFASKNYVLSNVHVLLQLGRVLFVVRSQYGPVLLLLLR